MSRTQLIVLTAMAILCCGCLVFIYHHVQSWISTPPGEPFAAFEDAFPEREPMPLEPVEPVEQPPAQPREIEISGRVFGPDLEPLGGGEIVLISGGGAEEIAVAQVDARGAFGFQAALRPRLCGLAYRRDGEPAAVFDEVLAGDAEEPAPPSGDPDGATLEAPGVLSRPESIRWSLNLPSADDGASGGTFRIDCGSVLAEDWGRGGRVQAEGRTSLPDGLHVHAVLYFDGYRLGSSYEGGEVRQGAWSVGLTLPESQRIYAGRFELAVAFNPRLEDVRAFDVLGEKAMDSIMAMGGEILGRRDLFIGDPEDARREDLEVQEYYRRALADAARLRTGFQWRFREILRMGSGLSPELVARHHEVHESWFQEKLIDEEGSLGVAAWRSFLDDRWRPALHAMIDEHRARASRKYEEAESALETLLDGLLRLSYIHSQLHVYPLFNLPPDPQDEYTSGSDLDEDLLVLQNLVEDSFRRLERFKNLVPDREDSAVRPRFGE